MIALRPYQDEALAAVAEAQGRGISRPAIQLPTGCGKTVIFGALIERRRERGPALVLAHRDELLDQAAAKVKQVSSIRLIGKVKAGANDWRMPVVVGSVQTLGREKRLHSIPRDVFETVVVDEAHHAAADSYRRVLDYFEPSLTLGVSATLERADGSDLSEVWEEVVYHKGIIEMIAAGYLVDVRGLQVRLARANFGALKVRHGDFQEGQAGRMLHEAGAPSVAVKAYLEHAAERKALIFTPTVELAHEMADVFRQAGVPCEALDGTTSPEERQAILRRLRDGTTRCVANCAVLTEGFDEPSVDCIIVARPTKSKVLYIQIVGRGLRLHPGKSDCLVLDLVGNTDRLDLLTVPRLFGIDPTRTSKGGTVTEMLAERNRPTKPTYDGHVEIEAEEADLFGRSRLVWVKAGDGMWVMSAGDGMISLVENRDDKWDVYHTPHRGHALPLQSGLDLGYAQGVGEEFVRSAGATALVDRDARWRSRPASERQRAALAKWKLPNTGLTAGEASDMLSAAIARSNLRRTKTAA